MASKKQENLDGKNKSILSGVVAGLSFDSQILYRRLTQKIKQLRRSIIDEQSIIGILGQDYNKRGRIFGEFRNAIKQGATRGVNQAFRRTGDMGKELKLDYEEIYNFTVPMFTLRMGLGSCIY